MISRCQAIFRQNLLLLLHRRLRLHRLRRRAQNKSR
jgi:hypothetical protein